MPENTQKHHQVNHGSGTKARPETVLSAWSCEMSAVGSQGGLQAFLSKANASEPGTALQNPWYSLADAVPR